MISIIKKVVRRFLRLHQKLRVAYYYLLSEDAVVEGRPIRHQPLLVTGRGDVVFHGEIRVGYFPSPGYFNTYAHFDLRGQGARIEIGDGTTLNNNAVLIADGASIRIGERCLIGLNFSVYTSDFHNLDPQKRFSTERIKLGVVIQENVFIGNNVTLLKGVTIGKNSVIGTGAIVSSDIPENVVAAGVPARVIRSL